MPISIHEKEMGRLKVLLQNLEAAQTTAAEAAALQDLNDFNPLDDEVRALKEKALNDSARSALDQLLDRMVELTAPTMEMIEDIKSTTEQLDQDKKDLIIPRIARVSAETLEVFKSLKALHDKAKHLDDLGEIADLSGPITDVIDKLGDLKEAAKA